MARKLSDVQESILLYVYHIDAQLTMPWWGVNWQPKKACGLDEWTRSDAASFSRSVRRLEERGLLFRDNGVSGVPALNGNRRTSIEEPPPTRANVLKLTDAGREMAKRLTLVSRDNVNR